MLSALLTGLAAAAIGAMLGTWTRRTLATLNYRLDDEQDLASPGQRWWIIWTSALSLASITARLAATDAWALAPVLLPLTLAGPALAAIDLDVMRLPNRVVAPVAVATIAGLWSTALTEGEWRTTLQGLLGGFVAGGTFALLSLITRGGIGFGDAKLAAIVGTAVGSITLATAWWALALGSTAAAVWALSFRPRGPVAYGPWILIGAGVAVVASGLSSPPR